MHRHLRKRNPSAVFLMVAVGVFLSTMDSSMINVALPSIMRSFGTSLAKTEWVVLIYLLTITVSLLFWGQLADRVGLTRIYLSGMLVFSIASVACYFSATLFQLITFRFVQGLGAAMMMATGPGIIKVVFLPGDLGKALGLVGVATSVGLMLGPVISGILIQHFSWRGLFLVTAPISFFVTIAGLFFLKPFSNVVVSERETFPFDWAGMALWTGMISLSVLIATHHSGIAIGILLIKVLACLTLFLLLVKTERGKQNPLFPLSLFRNSSYAIAMFCAALSFAVLFVVLILMPFYLDFVLGLPPKKIGLVMMAVPISVFFVSPLSGYFYDRIGARLLTTSGLSIAALGLLLLCCLSAESSAFAVAWRLAVLGCGQALFLSPNSATVLKSVDPGKLALSSGMLATARNLGMLAGAALAGLVFGIVFRQYSGGLDLNQYTPDQAQSFIYALRMTFLFTAVFSVLGAVLSSFRGKERLVNTQ